MKIVFALGKQGLKVLLVWLMMSLILALLSYEPTSVFKWADLLRAVATVIFSLLVYHYTLWLFQPSTFLATSLQFNPRMASQGALLGAAIATPLLLLQMSGWFNLHMPRPETFNWLDVILSALGLSIVAGVTEELMFRGYLLHAIEKVLGTWWAWLLQAALFGVIHYARPDVQLVDLIPLMFVGLLLGAAYILTRNLWFTIALHTVYDWIVLSYPGSIESMLKPSVEYEPIEYVVLVIFCIIMLALSLPMLKRASEHGHILPPQWKRDTRSSELITNEAA